MDKVQENHLTQSGNNLEDLDVRVIMYKRCFRQLPTFKANKEQQTFYMRKTHIGLLDDSKTAAA